MMETTSITIAFICAFGPFSANNRRIKTLPNVCATEMKKMKVWIKRETKKLVWVKMFSFVASQTKTDT